MTNYLTPVVAVLLGVMVVDERLSLAVRACAGHGRGRNSG
jgi:hypothetical protein